MLMEVVRELEDLGVQVRLQLDVRKSTNQHIDGFFDLEVDGRSVSFAIENRKRTPYPGELSSLRPTRDRLAGFGIPLLVIPFVSDSFGRHLSDAGWSWADEAGNFDLRAPGIRLRQRTADTEPLPKRLNLPKGSGSWAVIRCLISRGAVDSLTKLALDSGVSQPRISQVLRQLRDLGLVEQPTRSKWVAHRELLLDRFLREYPGPGGSTAYFYTLNAPTDEVRRLTERDPLVSLVVSGDVAADILSPWRRPSHLVIYTQAPIDLGHWIKITRAHSLGDANVIHQVPDDDSIFATQSKATWAGGTVPIADPSQILWDLNRLGGDDRAEAAEKLRTWLINR